MLNLQFIKYDVLSPYIYLTLNIVNEKSKCQSLNFDSPK